MSQFKYEIMIYFGETLDSETGKIIKNQENVFLSSPTIYSDKKNINSNIKSWRDKIGFVSQNIYLFDDTIEKNINLVSKNNDLTHFKNILRICELEELYSKYGNYPIGENSDKISNIIKCILALNLIN